MDILILGNGFDLAHGLKTRYTDFLNYCVNQLKRPCVYIPSDPFFTNMWIRHFLNVQQQLGNTWIDLEKEIYNVIKHISNFPFMNSQNCHKSFFIGFNDSSFSFYKFDKYISNYSMEYGTLNREYYRRDEHNWINYHICFSSTRGIINFLYDQLREFTILFKKYLLDEVLMHLEEKSKFQLSLKSIGVKEGSKDVYVLSFNYTDTCKRLYEKKFNTYCDINIKPVYVHGKAEMDKNNLVLGTHSFYNYLPNPINENISANFNMFKKHNQRHKYGTIEPYQDLLRKIQQSKTTSVFHIIGHSLDGTDHNILKHIFLANTDSIINIYYHDEEAQERLIHKIDYIIGEDEVMAKVRFIHQEDPERGILIPR